MTLREALDEIDQRVHGDIIDVLVFDPTAAVRTLVEQSEMIEEYGLSAMPTMPFWFNDAEHICYDPTRCKALMALSDSDLATYIKALRNARFLPLNYWFVRAMQLTLGLVEEEARQRVRAKRRKQTIVAQYGRSSWESADLLAEVRAYTGNEGKLRGGSWWFFCPFGHSSHRTQSLHVDAERRIWKCFGCPRAGGVIDWRRATAA